MSRYFVGSPAELALLQVALDQQHGLRDAMGLPTPREQLVTTDGGRTFAPASEIGASTCYDQPGTHWPVIEGDDGTTAIELPEIATVDQCLGKLVHGVSIPRADQLVSETTLPPRLRAAVELRGER
jgi:hypothetical protein